jgi:crossover junction endodeoxyribonuclease RuvC
MRILGIDPGSSVTGYGAVERKNSGIEHRAHGTLRFPRAHAQHQRLAAIYAGVTQWVAETQPDAAVVEKIFVSASPRSALILGQARGAALAALGSAGIPVYEYAPQQLKRSVTGNGSASKRQVQAMVRRLLTLETTPAADAADALALALCHAQAGPLAALALEVDARGLRARRDRGKRQPSMVVRRLR